MLNIASSSMLSGLVLGFLLAVTFCTSILHPLISIFGAVLLLSMFLRAWLTEHNLVISALLVITAAISAYFSSNIVYELRWLLWCIVSLAAARLLANASFFPAALPVLFICILTTVFLDYFGSAASLYYARDYQIDFIGGLFRQRGFMAEPAALGYFSGYFACLCVISRQYLMASLFSLLVVASASAAAVLLLVLQLGVIAIEAKSINWRTTFVLSLAALEAIWGQLVRKLGSDSFESRLAFVEEMAGRMSANFPSLPGMAPLNSVGVDEGSLNYLLTFTYQMGLLAPLFFGLVLLSLAKVKQWWAIISAFALSVFVGAYWEVPLFLALATAFHRPALVEQEKVAIVNSYR